MEIAGVDRTGEKCRSGKSRSKSYGTPNRDYFERILSYLNLVRQTCYGLCFCILVDRYDIRVCNFLIISNISL